MVVITHKGLAQRFAWGKNSSHAKLPIVSFPPIIRRRLLHHLAPSFLSRLEEKLCLTLFGVCHVLVGDLILCLMMCVSQTCLQARAIGFGSDGFRQGCRVCSGGDPADKCDEGTLGAAAYFQHELGTPYHGKCRMLFVEGLLPAGQQQQLHRFPSSLPCPRWLLLL